MADKKFSSEEMKRYFNDPEYRHARMKMAKKYFDQKHLILFGGLFVFVMLMTWYSVCHKRVADAGTIGEPTT